MRKLAVSVVTLTSLTACTQGDELGSNWSFELPENQITDDEQFARFGEQSGNGDFDSIAAAEPSLPEPSPSFSNGSEVGPDESIDPADLGAVPTQPDAELQTEVAPVPSDLSIDELVEFTFPQRGPRPNPLAQVRFSPTGPQASNRYIERIMSAADAARQNRPVDVSLSIPTAAPARAPEPVYLQPLSEQPQSDLSTPVDEPFAVEVSVSAPAAPLPLPVSEPVSASVRPTDDDSTNRLVAERLTEGIGPATLPPLQEVIEADLELSPINEAADVEDTIDKELLLDDLLTVSAG